MRAQLRGLTRCVAPLVFAALGGCATAVFDEARGHYYSGDPAAGVAVLDTAVQQEKIPQRDMLLLHLERGLMLQRAGLYRDSAEAFVRGSDYIEANGVLSVSEQARSLISNDWSKRYLGEYSEQLWVHSYAMMSFILAGDSGAAAVEARRALKVLDAHPQALQADAFSRALIALSFELAGQHNDAYVAYRQLQDSLSGDDSMALSTYRAARQVASSEGQATWREQIDPALWRRFDSGGPEAVLLISRGRGPRKTSGSLFWGTERISFPSYRPGSQPAGRVVLRDAAGKLLSAEGVSTNLFRVANDALGERGKQLLAKTALRGRVKHELVKNLRSNDQLAGDALGLVLFILEEADVRGWQSLPARLSLLRVPLQAGQTQLSVQLGADNRKIQLRPDSRSRVQVFSLHF